MSSSPSSPVKPGDILAGKYEVERVLGVGGMGVVVAARHLQLEEHVALKFMLPEAMQVEEAVARFLREARAAARLKSEHVARVTDVGTLENGAPYLVMEYLEGRDLGARLEEGTLPVTEAVDYLLQACEALAEAHAAGIIHRDLKPGNLFVATRPGGTSVLKILDFGVSKVTEPARDSKMTSTTTVVGSPSYMSPEQLKSSRNVDGRSDVWALGVTLYELLSGRMPFEGETMPVLCANILTEAPRDIQSVRKVPDALAAVIMRCFEKDPERRWQSVAELAHALVPFGSARGSQHAERASLLLDAPGSLQPRQLSRPSVAAPPRPAPPAEARTATSFTGTGAGPGKRVPMGVVAVGGVALVGVGALIAVLASRGGGAAPTGAAPSPASRDVATAPASTSTTTPAEPVPSVTPQPSAVPVASAAPVTSASAGPSAAASASAPGKAKPRPTPTPAAARPPDDDLYGARR